MQSDRTPEKCVLFPLFWKSIFVSLVVWRVQKSVFLRRSRFVSCVHTPVHVTVWLFVRICLHVTCTKKNLGNIEYERVCAHTKTRQIDLGLFWAHRWMEMTLTHIESGKYKKLLFPRSVQKNTLLCTSLPLSNKQEGVIGVFRKPSIQFQWFSHCLFVMNRERETLREVPIRLLL